MATKAKTIAKKAKAKAGTRAEVLKLERDWKENIRKSFQNAKVVKG